MLKEAEKIVRQKRAKLLERIRNLILANHTYSKTARTIVLKKESKSPTAIEQEPTQ